MEAEGEPAAALRDKKEAQALPSSKPPSLDDIHPAQADLLPPEQPELF
jgi:hypothetical protein